MITRRSAPIERAATVTVIRSAQEQPNLQTGNTVMKITRSNSQASGKGPPEYFNATACIDAPFAPRRHWQGATATIGVLHMAIAEALDGKTVDWMEQVTDAQYRG